jgi:hypothetical protein
MALVGSPLMEPLAAWHAYDGATAEFAGPGLA